ncbi:MAG: hypothetical protein IPH31_19135 [Lewinellaceae bacterium]|nr:hypothetical protein [Lewinellaceae bacterium]
MLLQSGSNGNVLGYNFSTDPYWEEFPNDAAGDIVLHGNTRPTIFLKAIFARISAQMVHMATTGLSIRFSGIEPLVMA